jgi:hypothetical protein
MEKIYRCIRTVHPITNTVYNSNLKETCKEPMYPTATPVVTVKLPVTTLTACDFFVIDLIFSLASATHFLVHS